VADTDIIITITGITVEAAWEVQGLDQVSGVLEAAVDTVQAGIIAEPEPMPTRDITRGTMDLTQDPVDMTVRADTTGIHPVGGPPPERPGFRE